MSLSHAAMPADFKEDILWPFLKPLILCPLIDYDQAGPNTYVCLSLRYTFFTMFLSLYHMESDFHVKCQG